MRHKIYRLPTFLIETRLSLVFYSYSDSWNAQQYADEETASKYPGNVYSDDQDERFVVEILDKGAGIPKVKHKVYCLD